MMAPRKVRHNSALILGLFLILFLALSACERQLQDQGDNLIPGTGTVDEQEQPATEDEAEEGETDAEVGAPAEEATAEVEDTPTSDQPLTEVPVEEPTAVVIEEEAPTEESPRPADETPVAEETAESAEEAAEEEPAETATEEAAAPETGAETAEEEETADADQETAEEGEEEAAEAEEAEAQATAEATPEATDERVHVVQAGENLYRIGLQYGISWVVLANYNSLPNANAIYVGQELKIPADPDAPAGTPTPTPAPSGETTYVVQAGDNLYRIGRIYNMNWVLIAEANGLVNPNQIFVGQELKIPTSGSTPAQVTHTVQPRETLFLISLHYGVPWMTIASANNLTAPYVIYPGQTLVIPAGG